MGSITEYLECPKCGQEAYWEFYYKSGEEYITCPTCGYQRKFYIANRQEGPLDVTEVQYQIEELGGFGAFKMQKMGSTAFECGSFIAEADTADFLKYVEDNTNSIEYASYTVKEGEEWVEKVLVDASKDNNVDASKDNNKAEYIY